MKYSVISGDGHVDINWLPHDLFTSNAPKQWRDKMPRVEKTKEGPTWKANGTVLAKVGFFRSDEEGTNPSGYDRESRLEEVGFNEDSRKGIYRPSDPTLRIRDQDLDGVDAEVIYGMAFGPDRMPDLEARRVVYQIYNDWAAAFSKSNPQRLATLACLPHHGPGVATEELKRAAKLGHRGAELRVGLTDTPIFHKDWDILWSAASVTNMPISFHLLSNDPKAKRPKDGAYLEIYWTVFLTMAQLDGVEHLSSIILSGACERFPSFKFVLGEAGISWIPYVIDRMDHEGEGIKGLTMKPSEYWYRQGHSTFQKEGIAGDILPLVGADNAIWGSDYPHNDCVWPDSRKTIEFNLKNLKDQKARRKVICENAGRLYGFIR